MNLKNLYNLANDAKIKYESEYINKEIILNQEFKNKFENLLKSKGDTIKYLKYSSEITIKESGNKIFFPNQWFAIATFFVEYAQELRRYHSILFDDIRKLLVDKEDKLISISDFSSLLKKAKTTKAIDEALRPAIEDFFESEIKEKEFLIRFLTDYDWWKGSKSVDRGDFFVSPILKLSGLVNSSQAYLATIVDYYVTEDDLYIEAKKMLESTEGIGSDKPILGGKNLIVYGAPGTGKSNLVNETYPNSLRVVFHSEYSYYDFIGSYKPTPLYRKSSGTITDLSGKEFTIGEPLINYGFVPGPFIQAILNALKKPYEMHTLLIEEINRANASAVFGDTFQLLDRKEDGSSEYPIIPSKDLSDFMYSRKDLGGLFNGTLSIPSNLNIVATMNSADQGVFVLDSAFKRRWSFEYIPILESNFPHEDSLVSYAGKEIKWKHFLKSVNDKLKDAKIEEDRLIGPFFINQYEISDPDALTSKLFIYLWDDVLRHKRHPFFDSNLKTYSDLISAYKDGDDIMSILEVIDMLDKIEKKEKLSSKGDEDEE